MHGMRLCMCAPVVMRRRSLCMPWLAGRARTRMLHSSGRIRVHQTVIKCRLYFFIRPASPWPYSARHSPARQSCFDSAHAPRAPCERSAQWPTAPWSAPSPCAWQVAGQRRKGASTSHTPHARPLTFRHIVRGRAHDIAHAATHSVTLAVA